MSLFFFYSVYIKTVTTWVETYNRNSKAAELILEKSGRNLIPVFDIVLKEHTRTHTDEINEWNIQYVREAFVFCLCIYSLCFLWETFDMDIDLCLGHSAFIEVFQDF